MAEGRKIEAAPPPKDVFGSFPYHSLSRIFFIVVRMKMPLLFSRSSLLPLFLYKLLSVMNMGMNMFDLMH